MKKINSGTSETEDYIMHVHKTKSNNKETFVDRSTITVDVFHLFYFLLQIHLFQEVELKI